MYSHYCMSTCTCAAHDRAHDRAHARGTVCAAMVGGGRGGGVNVTNVSEGQVHQWRGEPLVVIPGLS